MCWPSVFPVDDFVCKFPEFADETAFPRNTVVNCGNRAMLHIMPDGEGVPMVGPYREYALFLMTGHLLALDKQDADNGTESGGPGTPGTPFKVSVGSVSVESSKQNSFTIDDWNYWLNMTKYGRELLAYLEIQASAGIYLNTPNDSVRDLI